MEGGGHGLEKFGGDVVRSRGLAIGKTAEAFHVPLWGDLSLKHGGGDGGGGGDLLLPREWGKGDNCWGGGQGLLGEALNALDNSGRGGVEFTSCVLDCS